MSEKSFEPDITLGDLLMLSKLAALHQRYGKKPLNEEVEKELNCTIKQRDYALDKLHTLLGDVEVPGKEGGNRTRTPTAHARSYGGAAVLAYLLIQIAQQNETDQDHLLQEIRRMVGNTRRKYHAGVFKGPLEGNGF